MNSYIVHSHVWLTRTGPLVIFTIYPWSVLLVTDFHNTTMVLLWSQVRFHFVILYLCFNFTDGYPGQSVLLFGVHCTGTPHHLVNALYTGIEFWHLSCSISKPCIIYLSCFSYITPRVSPNTIALGTMIMVERILTPVSCFPVETEEVLIFFIFFYFFYFFYKWGT
jgi:hypothetical protein